MSERRGLAVVVEGRPMPAGEARAFWLRFSEWMEKNVGDLAGFAAAEGLASVHPEMHDGEPVLVASRSNPQKAYAPATKKQPGERRGGGNARKKT